MIIPDLGTNSIIALLSAGFTSGVHYALRFYMGAKNGNGTRAMHQWQETKDREILALGVGVQAATVATAALNGTIQNGVLPRLENLEEQIRERNR